MTAHRLITVAVSCVLSFAVSLAAQTPEAPARSFGEEVTVRVVTIPVMARTGRGVPVTDLQPADIVVQEGKQSYRVESVTRILEPTSEPRERPNVRLVTELGSEVHVNRTKSGDAKYMLLVVDAENDPPTRRDAVIRDLQKFVQEEVGADFQIAVMLYNGDVRLLQPFTNDRAAVVEALAEVPAKIRARARSAPGTEMLQLLSQLSICLGAPEGNQPGELDVQCLRDSGFEYVSQMTQKAENLIVALEQIVEYANGLEGYKSVLVVGGSASLNPALEAAEAMRAIYGQMPEIQDFEQSVRAEEALRPRLNDLLTRAYRGRTILNFIDRGVAMSESSPRFGQFEPGYRPMTTAFQAAQQDVAEIAAATGGTFVATTRVEEGLGDALRMMESAYEVSFTLPDDRPLTPRRLRGIKVRSTRSGVRLTHRHAFEGGRGGTSEMAGRIDVGGLTPHEIDGESVRVVPLRVVLEPRELGYAVEGNQVVARMTVHLQLKSADAVLLADSYHVLSHSYDADLWTRGDVEPPALVAYADVPPGDYVVEAVVSVPKLERRGAIRRAFTVAEVAVDRTPAEAPLQIGEAPVPEVEPEPVAAPAAPEAEMPEAETPEAEMAEAPVRGAGVRQPVAFERPYLGLVSGFVPVDLVVGSGVASVDLVLDGETVSVLKGEPWRLQLDLGPAPSPRELIAIARDARGKELARTRQWLNLPRPWAELEVVVAQEEGQHVAYVSWASVAGENPIGVTATLNERPIAVLDPQKIELGRVDTSKLNVLRVEARFRTAGIITRDALFGGLYVEQTNSELTAVALQVRDEHEPMIPDLHLRVSGTEVQPIAMEKGSADLVVVVDPRALLKLPGLVRILGSSRVAMSSRAGDTLLTPGRSDVEIRLLWPSAQRDRAREISRVGYRLFPSTAPAEPSNRGLLWHLAAASFPRVTDSVRLADGVAVAGPMAIERGRRRAVLLIHGGTEETGEYSVAAARTFLAELRVPLIVWSTVRPTEAMKSAWGPIESISGNADLHRAWTSLLEMLDWQRIVWIDGAHLPQTIEITPGNIDLAGTR